MCLHQVYLFHCFFDMKFLILLLWTITLTNFLYGSPLCRHLCFFLYSWKCLINLMLQNQHRCGLLFTSRWNRDRLLSSYLHLSITTCPSWCSMLSFFFEPLVIKAGACDRGVEFLDAILQYEHLLGVCNERVKLGTYTYHKISIWFGGIFSHLMGSKVKSQFMGFT